MDTTDYRCFIRMNLVARDRGIHIVYLGVFG